MSRRNPDFRSAVRAFLDRLSVESDSDQRLHLVIDGDLVAHSMEPADIRRAAVAAFVKEPRYSSPGGKRLTNYTTTTLPRRTMDDLLGGVDAAIAKSTR